MRPLHAEAGGPPWSPSAVLLLLRLVPRLQRPRRPGLDPCWPVDSSPPPLRLLVRHHHSPRSALPSSRLGSPSLLLSFLPPTARGVSPSLPSLLEGGELCRCPCTTRTRRPTADRPRFGARCYAVPENTSALWMRQTKIFLTRCSSVCVCVCGLIRMPI